MRTWTGWEAAPSGWSPGDALFSLYRKGPRALDGDNGLDVLSGTDSSGWRVRGPGRAAGGLWPKRSDRLARTRARWRRWAGRGRWPGRGVLLHRARWPFRGTRTWTGRELRPLQGGRGQYPTVQAIYAADLDGDWTWTLLRQHRPSIRLPGSRTRTDWEILDRKILSLPKQILLFTYAADLDNDTDIDLLRFLFG